MLVAPPLRCEVAYPQGEPICTVASAAGIAPRCGAEPWPGCSARVAVFMCEPSRISSIEKSVSGRASVRRRALHRRAFLRTGAAVALSTPALAAPAVAQSAPEIRWRMASSFPKSQETLFGTGQALSTYVAEVTDNKF